MNPFNQYLFPRQQFPFNPVLYRTIEVKWPEVGNHILSSFDTDNIILYLCCRESIAKFSVNRQHFQNTCPEYNHLNHLKMNWVLQPSFLSAMYYSKWGTRDQDSSSILALTVSRVGFEAILRRAVTLRSYTGGRTAPDAKYQWESDRSPMGEALDRGSIKISISKDMLELFLNEWLLKVDDISGYVKKARRSLMGCGDLMVPEEKCYLPLDASLKTDVGIDEPKVYDIRTYTAEELDLAVEKTVELADDEYEDIEGETEYETGTSEEETETEAENGFTAKFTKS